MIVSMTKYQPRQMEHTERQQLSSIIVCSDVDFGGQLELVLVIEMLLPLQLPVLRSRRPFGLEDVADHLESHEVHAEHQSHHRVVGLSHPTVVALLILLLALDVFRQVRLIDRQWTIQFHLPVLLPLERLEELVTLDRADSPAPQSLLRFEQQQLVDQADQLWADPLSGKLAFLEDGVVYEGALAEVVDEDAEGPAVGGAGDGLPPELLRGGKMVGGGGCVASALGMQFREVGEQRVAVVHDDDVLGVDTPVDHPHGVQFLESEDDAGDHELEVGLEIPVEQFGKGGLGAVLVVGAEVLVGAQVEEKEE